MGRLIDIDVLFDYFGNDAIDETTRSNIEYFVSEKGTVEAIPKADYENRLKADLKAILVELQLEIEEKYPKCDLCEYVVDYDYDENDISEYQSVGSITDITDLIQDKINALRGEK